MFRHLDMKYNQACWKTTQIADFDTKDRMDCELHVKLRKLCSWIDVAFPPPSEQGSLMSDQWLCVILVQTVTCPCIHSKEQIIFELSFTFPCCHGYWNCCHSVLSEISDIVQTRIQLVCLLLSAHRRGNYYYRKWTDEWGSGSLMESLLRSFVRRLIWVWT